MNKIEFIDAISTKTGLTKKDTKTVQVAASKAVSFKAGKDLRSKVNSK